MKRVFFCYQIEKITQNLIISLKSIPIQFLIHKDQ